MENAHPEGVNREVPVLGVRGDSLPVLSSYASPSRRPGHDTEIKLTMKKATNTTNLTWSGCRGWLFWSCESMTSTAIAADAKTGPVFALDRITLPRGKSLPNMIKEKSYFRWWSNLLQPRVEGKEQKKYATVCVDRFLNYQRF